MKLSIAATLMLLAGAAFADAPRMRAITYHAYGSPGVLRLESIDRPVPGDDQLLVRVRAASVNPLDWHFMEGTPYIARLVAFGLLAPKATRPGVDFAGTVEAVGKNVTRFKPGDDVFGDRRGAFAEYVTVPADGSVALKPAGVTFEQAAALPIAGVTALQALRDTGKLQPGQTVLINGASGGVGTFAVQIAKSLGAHVTGVCSTRNVELVRSLGAEQVVDYTKEDYVDGGPRYDLIIDNVGNRGLLENRRALKPNGRYVLVGGGGLGENRWIGPLPRMLRALVVSRFGQDMRMMLTDMNTADLAALAGMVQAGTVTPVIDRRFRLEELPAALQQLETGHARGKIVVTVEPGDGALVATGAEDRSPPGLIAAGLIGILIGVSIAPIVVAIALNRRFRRRHPGKRPYRWGYYFSIMSFLAGVGLAIVLEPGLAGAVACAAVYAALAWFFARRHRWAWLALTIFSFNPVAWVINLVYLRKRWAEDAVG